MKKPNLLIKGMFMLVVLSAARAFSTPVVSASTENAYDLVTAVNELRASNGLAPYQVDANLMAYAQEHSDYQAAIQQSTHIHSNGSLPDVGLVENVAAGTEGYVTVAIVVYQIWVDWGHRHTMIGYATGAIGAGVASSVDGNTYYTIDVRPGASATAGAGTPPPQTSATFQPQASVTFAPLLTNTPDAQGAIIHVVAPGETLWGIAVSYGVSVDEIRCLNGLAVEDTVIYIGQRLLIRPAGAVTPGLFTDTPPVQAAALQITPTDTPSASTAAPTRAVSATPAASSPSAGFKANPSPAPSAAPAGTRPSKERMVGLGIAAVLILAVMILLAGAWFGRGKPRAWR